MLKNNEVLTGVVRLSYANIWVPKDFGDGKPKYTCSLIIRKDDDKTLSAIKNKFKALLRDPKVITKLGGPQQAHSKGLHLPIRDGDTDEKKAGDAAYENSYFINCSNKEAYPPKIFDRHGDEILDKTEVYSGCYARVIISFFPYNHMSNFGISASITAIQKWKDGEALGGVNISSSDFDDGFSDGSADDTAADDDLF